MKTFSLHSERIIRDNKYVSPHPPPQKKASARMKALSDAASISPLYEGTLKATSLLWVKFVGQEVWNECDRSNDGTIKRIIYVTLYFKCAELWT